MSRKHFFIGFITTLALLAASNVFGQPPLSGTTGPPCFPPPCIPIDGGTSLLIAAGLIWGGKKAYDYRKKDHEPLD